MRRKKVFILGLIALSFLVFQKQNVRAEEEMAADLYQAGALDTKDSEIRVYSLQAEEMEAQIYESLSQVSPELDISGWGISLAQKGELTSMFERVVNGHPELFYVSNIYGIVPDEASGKAVKIRWQYREQDSNRIAAMKAAMEARVSEVLARTDSSMTQVEKLMIVHEALVSDVSYTFSTAWDNGKGCYTAYCALVEGRAVCQGYALAFGLLAERLGIPTEFVGSSGLNHAWNLVILDGETYHVDCTWDDRDRAGEVLHQNFMLSDAKIRSTGHSVWNDSGLSGSGTRYDEYYWREPEYNCEFIKSDSVWYQISQRGAPAEQWKRIGISLLNPEEPSPGPIQNEKVPLSVFYQAHVQSVGWQDVVSDGAVAGTMNRSKRMEAIKIGVSGNPEVGIAYQAHVQSAGWQDTVFDGVPAGTENRSKRMEAIRIWLTGTGASDYDIYYRVYVQSYGWLGWTKNGESAGTEGLSKRLEAIEIRIIEKGSAAPGNTEGSFVGQQPAVSYQTHVQSYGWQEPVRNGALAGTTGRSKRLEAIKISLSGLPVSGGIRYRTHVQSMGWQDWTADGAAAGTEGRSKRLEAVRIELTGEAAEQYDVCYRVHVQSAGWQEWVKNGELAGTEGRAKRLEAIEIRLEKKN